MPEEPQEMPAPLTPAMLEQPCGPYQTTVGVLAPVPPVTPAPISQPPVFGDWQD